MNQIVRPKLPIFAWLGNLLIDYFRQDNSNLVQLSHQQSDPK